MNLGQDREPEVAASYRGGGRQRRRSRLVTAVTAGAVVMASLPAIAFTGPGAAAAGRHLAPQVEKVDAVGGPAHGRARTVRRAASAAWAAPVWPRPGAARAVLPAAHGAASLVQAGSLPVRVGRGTGGGPAEATVRVVDRAKAPAAWRDGLVLRVEAPQAGNVTVSVDYRGFEHAHGGDWPSRLRLWRVPDCPARSRCAATPLPSAEHPETRTVTGEVPVTAAGTTVVLAAAPAGPQGDFAATSLAPSATWSSGGSTGDFTWSYPMRVPPSIGGPAPDLSLSYSSAGVDGRSDATNNQPSWVGEGFDYWPGYIERSYVSCDEDMGGTADNDKKTGDMCWRSDNATMTLNGRGTELVYQSGKGWHARSEDGSKIEKLDGAANGDNDGEYWRVTTPDGVQYYFGKNHLDGQTATTGSTWTMPVAGNNTGEQCHGGTFVTSFCAQAWRWNLDYVVDPRGNTMSYWYAPESNQYARNLTDTDNVSYTRGGTLTRIDYGTWDRGSGDRSVNPTAQVVFTSADRCASGCATHDATHWPDVPWDQACAAGATSCDDYSPTFWSTKRLAKVTTRVWDTTSGPAKWQDVDSWTLDHTYPPEGDGSDHAGLWLNSIVHTGHVGGTADMPPVTFEPVSMPNRVLTAHNTTNNRQRIANIVSETGAKTQVTYSLSDCGSGNLPSSPSDNTKRCYPVVGPDPADPAKDLTEWWHKYVVTKVSASDLQVMVDGTDHGAPVQNTTYTYGGAPAWHYADDDGLVKPAHKTWNQFRGYATVDVRTGDAPAQTLTRTTYLRGMHGDRASASGGTRPVTVGASVGGETVYDEDQFASMVREQAVYDGDLGKPVSKTVNVPWMSSATASRTINKDTVTARFTDTKTTYSATALGVDGDRGWRTAKTSSTFDDTYGTTGQTQDDGDIGKTGDEQCVTYTYNRNTDKNIVQTVKQTTTLAVPCGTAPAGGDDVISDVRDYYDGAGSVDTAPKYGSVTRTDAMKDWTPGSGTVWQTTGQSAFDASGRIHTSTDVRGNTTTTAYTPAAGGPVTKVTTSTPDPGGGDAWVSSVDSRPYWGTPVRSTDANGRITDADHDALGRVTRVWKVGWAKDAHPDKPSVEYGYLYSPTRAAYPYTVTKTLNAAGGYLTSYQISDAFLRPRQTQTAGVGGGRVVTDTLYDKAGRAATAYGQHVEPGDPAGALWWEPEWSVPALTKTVYDNASRPTNTILYGTDGVANLVEKWRTTTVDEGDMVKVTPPDGGTPTTTLTDIRGHTVELRQHTTDQGVDGAYQASHYTYDHKNQLTKVTDPAGDQWTYAFDAKGRQIRADDPDKGRTTSEYDDYDELFKTTDAGGNTLAYQYDKIGRKIGLYDDTVSAATKRAEWTYDRLYDGQVVRGQLTETARYEPPGSATPYRWQVRGFNDRYQPGGVNYIIPGAEGAGLAGTHVYSYGYSAYDGTATDLSYPAAGDLPAETVTTRYDQASGLPAKLETTLDTAKSYVATQQYTAYGEPTLTTSQTAGGVYVENADYYDPTTRRLKRTVVQPETTGAAADDTGYSYDPTGNVTSIVETTPAGVDAQCFRHDTLRRLTSAWTPKSGVTCKSDPSIAELGGPTPYWLDWDIDRKTGNRLSEVSHSGAGNTSRTYTYPDSGADAVRPHAVTSVTTDGPGPAKTTANYAYDRDGNTTCRPADAGTNTCPSATDSEGLTWDPEGRLAVVSASGKDAGGNLYDPDGTRLIHRDATGTTLYLPGQEIHRESGKVTGTRYYTFGDKLVGSRTGSGLTWLYTDHQGTQKTEVDERTQTAATRRQTPYGTSRGTQPTWPNDKGFVGGDKDTTGLTHLGARDYDPTLGRFLSVDPVQDLTDPQQWNGYAYADNAPDTSSDPNGLKSCSDDQCGPGADYEDNTGKYHYVLGHNDGCGGCSGTKDPTSKRKSCSKRFCLGAPRKPVNHGPSDDKFVYDPSAIPTPKDLWSRAIWQGREHGCIVSSKANYGPCAGWGDFPYMYADYWSGTGDSYVFDYEQGYLDDPYIRDDVDQQVREAQTAAEVLSRSASGASFQMTGSNENIRRSPKTEEWQKTIGSYDMWSSANVTVDGDNITMRITVHAEDRFNFNPDNKDIATGVADKVNGRFAELGWAKGFNSSGSLVRDVSWKMGSPSAAVVSRPWSPRW